MTLIYKYKGETYTIEELLKKHPIIQKFWDIIVKDEKQFWGDITSDDLIIEASDCMEEELLEHNIKLTFVDNDDEPFDYALLLRNL